MRFNGVGLNFVVKVLCKQLSDQCVGESHVVRVISSEISTSRI